MTTPNWGGAAGAAIDASVAGPAPAQTKGSTSSTSRRSYAIASPMVEIRKVMRRQPDAANDCRAMQSRGGP
jgi:hypothetical protein